MSLKSSPLVEGFASFLLLFALALLLESDNSFLPNIIPITPLDSTLTLFSLIAKFQTVSCVLRHSNGCYHMCCPLSICILRTETNLIFPCIALNWGTPTKKKPRFPSHQGEEIFYLWGLNSSGMQEVTESSLVALLLLSMVWSPPLVVSIENAAQFSSIASTPETAACQASLSITNSQSSPKPMSIESVMPSHHLILCRPLLLPPSIFPSIRVFSNESALRIRWPAYWSFSFSISPSNEYSGLISFRMDCLDLLAVQGTLKSLLQHDSSKASILWHSAFFVVQLSHAYVATGKPIVLTRWAFVGKVMPLLFNMLSRLVIAFLQLEEQNSPIGGINARRVVLGISLRYFNRLWR